MAAAFRSANSPHTPEAIATNAAFRDSIMTPSHSAAASRPRTAPHVHTIDSGHDDGLTPTRATFSPAMSDAQRPSPSPYTQGSQNFSDKPRSDNSHPSDRSGRRESMDTGMDDSDGEGAADDGAGSDDESVNADGTRSGKKKKSQRFYCTDFPPCSLSFTRSEHLARHIRKHTGERPFQCHCSRRFSRLDNLRQHAQTVHVNEDIPIDSLAATGSRFQRQIRTDRVRQAGNRARASTGGSAGGPQRGHSKSLSTSSINSISSVGSNYSTSMDARRRPPPLVMANPHGRPGDGTYPYRPPSPTEYGTPTSSNFSTGQTSPRWVPGVMSPASSHSRSQSMYTAGSRTPGRRLSVPSAPNPFQSGVFPNTPGRPMFGGAGPLNSSHSVAFAPPNATMVASPTISTAGWSSRRGSAASSVAEEAWRRRTWHPDSHNFSVASPSQLNNVVSQSSIGPNPPPPIANPSNNRSGLQLPGIESFDNPAQTRPATPPGRHASPMRIDPQQLPQQLPPQPQPQPQPQQAHQGLAPQPHERRNLNVYDASLQRGLTRLEINHSTPPRDGAHKWAMEVNTAMSRAQAEHARGNLSAVRFEGQPQATPSYPSGPGPNTPQHHHTLSAPPISTPREGKRRGWYNGPVTVHREEVPREQQDPRAAHVDRMVHPNFNDFSGFPARDQSHPPPNQQAQQPQQDHRPPRNESFGPLDALVAVATSEGSTAAAY